MAGDNWNQMSIDDWQWGIPESRIDEMRASFEEFHEQNPHVWKLFEGFTFEAINVGRPRYSAKAVVERIRWHVDIETNDPDFKINNNHTAFYARMFMDRHPEHEGFFEMRIQLSASRRPTGGQNP